MRQRMVRAAVCLTVLAGSQGCGNNPLLDSLLINALNDRLDQAIDDAVVDTYGDRGGNAILTGDVLTDILVNLNPSPIAIVLRNRLERRLEAWREQLGETEQMLKQRLLDWAESIQDELLIIAQELRDKVDAGLDGLPESGDIDVAAIVRERLGRLEFETLGRALDALDGVEAEFREVVEDFQATRAMIQADLEAEAAAAVERVATARASLLFRGQELADEAQAAVEALADRSEALLSQLADDLVGQVDNDAPPAVATLQAELDRIFDQGIAGIDTDSPTLAADLEAMVDNALLEVDAALTEAAARLRTVVQLAEQRLPAIHAALQDPWTAHGH